MSGSFTVCTWNVGREEDFCNYESKSSLSGDQLTNEVRKIRQVAAEKITNVADVFCLQEVFDEGHPEIECLTNAGYELYSASNVARPDIKISDVAIAIKSESFSNIVNLSFFDYKSNNDVAVVIATHRTTGLRCLFVSAHVPGFPIEVREDEKLEVEQVGRNHCIEIVNKAQELANLLNIDKVILGADMNGIAGESLPDSIKGKDGKDQEVLHRFKVFEKAGYELYRQGTPTNINTKTAENIKEREVDYFLVKALSFWEQFRQRISIVKTSFSPGLDPAQNPSDHMPIYIRVERVSHGWAFLNLLAFPFVSFARAVQRLTVG